MNAINIYEEITNAIVAAIESNQLDEWSKPWRTLLACKAQNAFTKTQYRGVNVLQLSAARYQHGYQSNEWMTFKQALLNETPVKKGEKATPIVYWGKTEVKDDKNSTTDDPKTKSVMYAKRYMVFNVDQLEGFVHVEPEPTTEATFNLNQECEAILENSGAHIIYDQYGDKAAYSRSRDAIYLPRRELFCSEDFFYSVAVHELAHWTGSETRLSRPKGVKFGDEIYAFEELIAELTSCFVGAEMGLAVETLDSHASYLASWLKSFKSDPKYLFKAASAAQKAADMILSFRSETAINAPIEATQVAENAA